MIINDTSNGKFYRNSYGNGSSENKSVIVNDEEDKFMCFADQLNNCDEEDFDENVDPALALS